MAKEVNMDKDTLLEATRLAKEFVADPDKRAQVKVQLAANGWPKLADLIDEAVIVSRAFLILAAQQPESIKYATSCCCKIADEETLIEPCALHAEWKQEAVRAALAAQQGRDTVLE